jgi:hypothetical protein
MPKKERTFAAKLAHEARKIHKKTCDVCGNEKISIVHFASVYSDKGVWRPQRRCVSVCDCNRKEIYG